MSEKENIAKAPSGRPQRIPVGYRNRFEVSNKDPNFSYRIVKDQDGRIQEFKDAGYEVVEKSQTKLGASRIEGGASLGSTASIPLGAGDTGVLMRIPKEYYEEDQLRKVEAIKEKEKALRSPVQNGQMYGDIKVS